MTSKNAPYVITKFDKVNVIMEECPRATELLAEYGIHCVGCYFSEDDTLQIGGQMHGMSDEEIDEMIDEINTELEKEWRKENSKHEIPASQRGERNPKQSSKSE